MKSLFNVTYNRKNWDNLHILHRMNLIVFSFIFPSIVFIEIDETNSIQEKEVKEEETNSIQEGEIPFTKY